MNAQVSDGLPEVVDPLGWHPFQFFDYLTIGGPLVLGSFALVCVSFGAFFYLAIRRTHIGSFFSWPLFLAFVPFAVCAALSFMAMYIVLLKISISGMIDWGMNGMGRDLRQAGHVFQFGVLLSSVLVATHAFVHIRFRRQQSANPRSSGLFGAGHSGFHGTP